MQEPTNRKSRPISRVPIGVGVLALFVIALSLVVLGGTQSVRASGSPAIQITPNSGPYHTVTVVTGQGFRAHEQVQIFKSTRAFVAYETDGTGSFVGAPHRLIGPGPRSGDYYDHRHRAHVWFEDDHDVYGHAVTRFVRAEQGRTGATSDAGAGARFRVDFFSVRFSGIVSLKKHAAECQCRNG